MGLQHEKEVSHRLLPSRRALTWAQHHPCGVLEKLVHTAHSIPPGERRRHTAFIVAVRYSAVSSHAQTWLGAKRRQSHPHALASTTTPRGGHFSGQKRVLALLRRIFFCIGAWSPSFGSPQCTLSVITFANLKAIEQEEMCSRPACIRGYTSSTRRIITLAPHIRLTLAPSQPHLGLALGAWPLGLG